MKRGLTDDQEYGKVLSNFSDKVNKKKIREVLESKIHYHRGSLVDKCKLKQPLQYIISFYLQ